MASKKFYNPNNEEDQEILRRLAFASDSEDFDDIVSESDEEEYVEEKDPRPSTSSATDPGPSRGPRPSTSAAVPSSASFGQSRRPPPRSDSSESEEESDMEEEPVVQEWASAGIRRQRFPFNEQPGIQGDSLFEAGDPIDFYEHFIDQELTEMIATETNRFATQKIREKTESGKMRRRSRDQHWAPTSANEIKLLLGIIFLQGIVQKPKIAMFFFPEEINSNTGFF